MTTYLWFFVAFLSGWAMRVLIGNVADLIQSRTYGRSYLAVALWNVFLMLLVIEMWVAAPFASDGSTSQIETGSFLLFILLPTAVTLMAYLLQPEPGKYEIDMEISVDGAAEADSPDLPAPSSPVRPLEEAFNYNRSFFFGILLALPVVSVLRELVAGDFVLMSQDLGFRALIAVGAIAGFFVKSRRGNTILASLMVAVIVAYTLVVFPYVTTGGG
ncbi:MAG: hypothetical protein WC054_09710 [Candidatus Nanopelagicales bacterium]